MQTITYNINYICSHRGMVKERSKVEGRVRRVGSRHCGPAHLEGSHDQPQTEDNI